MDRDKDLKPVGRIKKPDDPNRVYFAQIDFGVERKRQVITTPKDDGPCYNPLFKRFYTQKLIWYDDQWGWMIQGDLILFWVIFAGVVLCSIF